MRYNDLTISKRYVIHVVYTVLGRTAHSGLHTATQIANCICRPFRHARSERPLEELARRSGRGGSRLAEVDLFSGVAHKYLPQGGIADIKLLEAVLLLDGRHLGEHLAPGSVRRGDPVLQHTLRAGAANNIRTLLDGRIVHWTFVGRCKKAPIALQQSY